MIDRQTGAPIVNAQVTITDVRRQEIKYQYWTDEAGSYRSDVLPPSSTYHVIVRADSAIGSEQFFWVDQQYQNSACPSRRCLRSDATWVVIEAGGEPVVIDFSLVRGGIVGGRVVDRNDQPVAEMEVKLSPADQDGFFSSLETHTGDDGTFEFYSLPPGTYFATARSKSSAERTYPGQLYDQHLCVEHCDVSVGDPIEVKADTHTGGILFRLQEGWSVTGRFVSAVDGSPLGSGGYVKVYDLDGGIVGRARTNVDGDYRVTGIPMGEYWIEAEFLTDKARFLKVYDDVDCAGSICLPENADVLRLGPGHADPIIDFSFDIEVGEIHGRVTDTNGQPQRVSIVTYDAGSPADGVVDHVVTDEGGEYRIVGVKTGHYFVKAIPAAGATELAELFDDVPCGKGCGNNSGQVIEVVGGSAATGIDFVLDQTGAEISGQLAMAPGGEPVGGSVILLGQDGQRIERAVAPEDGRYRLTGLGKGVYYLFAETARLVPQAYDSGPCDGKCRIEQMTPLKLADKEVLSNVNFLFTRGGKVSGKVISEQSGDVIIGMPISVMDKTGQIVAEGYTRDNGQYLVSGIAPGEYYVRTAFSQRYGFSLLGSQGSGSYVDQLFGGISCFINCEVDQGALVVVKEGETSRWVDFSLLSAGGITGRVTSAVSGSSVSGVIVTATLNGSRVTQSQTDSDGVYVLRHLAEGNYQVAAMQLRAGAPGTPRPGGVIVQAFEDIPCYESDCMVSTGDPVGVRNGQMTPNVNFRLGDSSGILNGEVITMDNEQPVAEAMVELFDAQGLRLTGVLTDESGRFHFFSLKPGRYYARVAMADGRPFTSMLWNDQHCDSDCKATDGDPIQLNQGVPVTHIQFRLPRKAGFDTSDPVDQSADNSIAAVDSNPPARVGEDRNQSSISLPETQTDDSQKQRSWQVILFFFLIALAVLAWITPRRGVE